MLLLQQDPPLPPPKQAPWHLVCLLTDTHGLDKSKSSLLAEKQGREGDRNGREDRQ